MNIKFHKQHLHVHTFNFKINKDYQASGRVEIKATVEIPKNYRAEIKKNDETRQLGITISIPLELKSAAFEFSCEYEALFATDEIEEIIYIDDSFLKKNIEKSLPKVLTNYLNLVNKEVVNFINKKTNHEVSSNVNFFSSLSANVNEVK